jgi:hypothetical protein
MSEQSKRPNHETTTSIPALIFPIGIPLSVENTMNREIRDEEGTLKLAVLKHFMERTSLQLKHIPNLISSSTIRKKDEV